jgi:hypothetical protein
MAKKKTAPKKKRAKKKTLAAEVPDITIPPEMLLMQAAEVVLASVPPLEATCDWSLSGEQAATLERWCSTRLVSAQLTEMATRDKHEVIDALLPTYVDCWYEEKQQPSNPRLATPLAGCNFIVQPGKAKVELSKGTETAKQALQAQGLHWRRAEVFAAYVTSDTQDEWIGGLSEMRDHGVQQIKEAANDLYDAVLQHPTWRLLVQPRTKHRVAKPEDFVKDLPNKAKSAGEMLQVLRVIQPVAYPSHAVHLAASASVERRRLWEAEHQTEFFSPDGVYRVVAQQRLVVVYSRSHGAWHHRKTSQRPSPAAARTFAKQVSQDGAALGNLLS